MRTVRIIALVTDDQIAVLEKTAKEWSLDPDFGKTTWRRVLAAISQSGINDKIESYKQEQLKREQEAKGMASDARATACNCHSKTVEGVPLLLVTDTNCPEHGIWFCEQCGTDIPVGADPGMVRLCDNCGDNPVALAHARAVEHSIVGGTIAPTSAVDSLAAELKQQTPCGGGK